MEVLKKIITGYFKIISLHICIYFFNNLKFLFKSNTVIYGMLDISVFIIFWEHLKCHFQVSSVWVSPYGQNTYFVMMPAFHYIHHVQISKNKFLLKNALYAHQGYRHKALSAGIKPNTKNTEISDQILIHDFNPTLKSNKPKSNTGTFFILSLKATL